MIARNPPLADVVGHEFERQLAARARGMLYEAYAQSGAALPPHAIGIHVEDALGIAAARVLVARGFLRQDLDGNQPAEIYALFAITDSGKASLRQQRVRHT